MLTGPQTLCLEKQKKKRSKMMKDIPISHPRFSKAHAPESTLEAREPLGMRMGPLCTLFAVSTSVFRDLFTVA